MKKKKITKLDLLLKILSDYQWHWNDELAYKVSHRFGATIKTARAQGYPIKSEQVGSKWRYRLAQA